MLRYFKIFTLLFFALPLFSCAGGEQITIIHTDAMKGRVLPQKNKDGTYRGGMALLSSAIQQIRKKNPTSYYLVLDAGSSLNGSAYAYYTQMQAIVYIMEQLGYQTMTVGNRDFDFGLSLLKNVEKKSSFPFLSANLVNNTNGKPVFSPYSLFTTQKGTRIAVIGLSDEETIVRSLKENVENIKVLNTETVLDSLLPKLKSKADLIILLSSLRLARDEQIAAEYHKQIDLIISRTSDYVFRSSPISISNIDLVVTEGKSYSVGAYTFKLNSKKEIIRKQWQNFKVNSSYVQPDSRTGELISLYTQTLHLILNTKIGTSKRGLPFIEKSESPIANFIADFIIKATKADLSLINEGGIRESLGTRITAGNLYRALPFENTVCTLQLKGKDILSLLEQSVTFEKGPLLPGGLRYTYDPEKIKGHRVTSVSVHGKPLLPNHTYTVATLNFLADGGDLYSQFTNGINVRYFQDLKLMLTDFLREFSPVDAQIDGRFRILRRKSSK